MIDGLTEAKHVRMASAFAISNMGCLMPDRIAENLPDGIYDSVRSDVSDLAGHLMETDEHEEIFVSEAEMWYEDIEKRGLAEIQRVHGPTAPWIQQIVDA